MKQKKLSQILLLLVSLSAGAMIGGAFIHILPDAFAEINGEAIFTTVLVSFILFFFIEKLLFWRHCHQYECKIHTFGYMNLVGDAVHNFIDGLIIAASFVTDIKLGIITSLAVALHEIPQEIGDFGVLLYAGLNKRKAIFINFLVALTVILGGIVGFIFSMSNQKIISYLLPFAAGGFIYIAASDLMPEIRKETNLKKSVVSFGMFIFGIAMMYFIRIFD